jgi:hypothetical protein
MIPRSEEHLKKIFDALVEDATWEFRKKPLVTLAERDPLGEIDDTLIDSGSGYERAVLVAKVILNREKRPIAGKLSKYMSIETTRTKEMSVGIFESEIPIVLKLIDAYKQPDPDFDPELEYWQMWCGEVAEG